MYLFTLKKKEISPHIWLQILQEMELTTYTLYFLK